MPHRYRHVEPGPGRAARVVGLDFFDESVAAARILAPEACVPVEYVQSDVYDAVDALGAGRFDLVYTGKGALVWLPDLDRWARAAFGLLRPGGVLYLVEFHRLVWALAEGSVADGLRIANDYLASGTPVEVEGNDTYTDGPPLENGPGRTFEWNHDLAEVVTAVARAGFRVTCLREIDVLPWEPWSGMVRSDDGWWRLPDGSPRFR